MCLMCIWYADSCDKPECVEWAKTLPKDLDYYYRGRYTSPSAPGTQLFLWMGGTEVICPHILASHGPECDAIKNVGDYCNCYKDDGGWIYD